MSLAVSAGGLGSSQTDAFSLGLYGDFYGVTASVSYGVFDDFDLAYPFCHQHLRQEPILSEYLVGYSFAFWSNFDPKHEAGYTLHFAPVFGWYVKDFSNVMKTPYEIYRDHRDVRHSYGVIATLEFYHGTIVNLKATQWGGEIGLGYSFFSPYRRRNRK